MALDADRKLACATPRVPTAVVFFGNRSTSIATFVWISFSSLSVLLNEFVFDYQPAKPAANIRRRPFRVLLAFRE